MPAVMGVEQRTTGGSEAVERRDLSNRRAALILFFQHDEAYTGAKGPQVASADNSAKRFRAFVRQILFRKACARMDSGAHSAHGSHSQD
jgi:hypothetical protein